MRGEPREDLPQLLSSQGLAKYTDIFLRHEIDLPTFSTLTDDELKEIGISTFGKPVTFVVFCSLFVRICFGQWCGAVDTSFGSAEP